MMNRLGAIALVAALLGLASTLLGQEGRPASLTTITHVGLVVRDVSQAAKAWQELFDATISAPRRIGRDATAVDARLENLTIELLQPELGPSPWRTFLDRYGQGIHHVAFETNNVPAAADWLVKNGGRKLDGATAASALVDFDQEMGGAIEVVAATPRAAAVATRNPASHVIALTHHNLDEERTRAFWGRVLGIEVPPAFDLKGVVFPPDCECDREAYVRETNISRPGGIVIHLIQPVGGNSPWRRAIARHEGIGNIHFFMPSQQALDERVAFLVQHAGRRTIGNTGARIAYIDLQERLGITVLLTGPR